MNQDTDPMQDLANLEQCLSDGESGQGEPESLQKLKLPQP